MKRSHLSVMAISWLLILSWQGLLASGQGDVSIKLNGGANVAYIGETNTMEIWITNDAQLTAISTCFKIDIDDPYTWVKPYGNRPPSAPVVNEEGDAVGKFDATGGLNVIDRIFNTRPDTVMLNGSRQHAAAPDSCGINALLHTQI